MVTWLEGNHRSANPEAIEDFIFLWPFFCLWSLQILSFGKISLQVPLCSSLCLAVPCRMSFSSWLWAVKREAIFRVHKANLHGELHIVAFCTSIFSWETQERIDHGHLYFWQNILHVNSLFSRKKIWVLRKAWSRCEQGAGMSCLDGIIFLGLG